MTCGDTPFSPLTPPVHHLTLMLSVTMVALGAHVLGDALPVLGAESFPHALCPGVWSPHDGQGAESEPLLQGIDVTQQEQGPGALVVP